MEFEVTDASFGIFRTPVLQNIMATRNFCIWQFCIFTGHPDFFSIFFWWWFLRSGVHGRNFCDVSDTGSVHWALVCYSAPCSSVITLWFHMDPENGSIPATIPFIDSSPGDVPSILLNSSPTQKHCVPNSCEDSEPLTRPNVWTHNIWAWHYLNQAPCVCINSFWKKRIGWWD